MKRRILIIDDEPQLAKALAVRLCAAGFTPETARDGAEGLVKAKSDVPDLIVLDLLMPNLNGYEVARQLKADWHTRNVPILVLTAERRCLVTEATRILFKPFDSREFLSTVKELLAITSTEA